MSPYSDTASQHLFSKLPPEVRFKIWDMNLPPTRVVTVKCGAKSLSMPPPHSPPLSPPLSFSSCPWSPQDGCFFRDPSNDAPSIYTCASSNGSRSRSPHPLERQRVDCTSPAPVPANLHTCQESRREALRRYSLFFGIARQPARVFFDPRHDWLYLGARDGFAAAEAQLRTLLALADPAELAWVRRLALNDALFGPPPCAAAAVLSPYGQGSMEESPRPVGVMMPPSPPSSPPPPPHAVVPAAAPMTLTATTTTAAAISQVAELLAQVALHMPNLRELVFVPYDENPVYSGEATLVDPQDCSSRTTRFPWMEWRITHALVGVSQRVPHWRLPAWRVMVLAADPRSKVVYERRVMGLDGTTRLGVIQEGLMGPVQGARAGKPTKEEDYGSG